jgi:hypothetical protein
MLQAVPAAAAAEGGRAPSSAPDRSETGKTVELLPRGLYTQLTKEGQQYIAKEGATNRRRRRRKRMTVKKPVHRRLRHPT